jgi:ABC-type amino acid transport substrate-binding protein
MMFTLALLVSACGASESPNPEQPAQRSAEATTAPTGGTAPEGADQTTLSDLADPRAVWAEDFPLFGPAETGDGSLKRLQDAGNVVICNQVGINPILYQDDESGELVGYNDDIAAELTSRLGIENHEYSDVPFASFIATLQGGQCDFAMGDMAATVERESANNIKFAYPYVVYFSQWVVPEDSDVESIDQLTGKFGAVTGSLESLTIESHIGAGLDGEVVTFEGADAAYLALSQGSIDAVLGEPSQNEQALGSFEGLRVIGDYVPYVISENETEENPYTQISVAPVTREEDGDLNWALSAAMHAMHDDGTLKSIFEEWDVLYDPSRLEVVRSDVTQ